MKTKLFSVLLFVGFFVLASFSLAHATGSGACTDPTGDIQVDCTECAEHYHLDTSSPVVCVLDACINIPGSTEKPSGYFTDPNPIWHGVDCYACSNYATLGWVSGIPDGYFLDKDSGVCMLYACSNHAQLAGNPTGEPPGYQKNLTDPTDRTCTPIICTGNPEDQPGVNCHILGCTNPSAVNYNSTATLDDGSCVVYGLPGDGRSDGGSSCPSCTQPPASTSTGGTVLGASTTTLAATGTNDQLERIVLAITSALVVFFIGRAILRANENP